MDKIEEHPIAVIVKGRKSAVKVDPAGLHIYKGAVVELHFYIVDRTYKGSRRAHATAPLHPPLYAEMVKIFSPVKKYIMYMRGDDAYIVRLWIKINWDTIIDDMFAELNSVIRRYSQGYRKNRRKPGIITDVGVNFDKKEPRLEYFDGEGFYYSPSEDSDDNVYLKSRVNYNYFKSR